jgi:hypothetical protein
MFNRAVERGYATSNPAEKTAKAQVIGEAPRNPDGAENARVL